MTLEGSAVTSITLYRYLPLSAGLATIESGEFQVGQISKLNDPFDCLPALIHSKAKAVRNTDPLAEEMVRSLSAVMGIVCFSAKWEDPVLWSHYAESHRGVALVLEMPKNDHLFEVKYEPERAKYDVAKSAHEQAEKSDVPLFFRVKSPSWKYEEEYRQFIDLKACKTKGGRYFTGVNPGVFKGVILGLRCEQAPEYFQNIFRSNKLTGAKVWKTEKHPEKFLLTRSEAI